MVPEELLEQPPRLPITFEKFLPPELQSAELHAHFGKKNEDKVVPCLTIIMISNDEEIKCSETNKEGHASSPICIPASPEHKLVSPECDPVLPKEDSWLLTSVSPEYSPVSPMHYLNTPEYIRDPKQRKPEYKSDTELVRRSRRLQFEDNELKYQSDDELLNHSEK